MAASVNTAVPAVIVIVGDSIKLPYIVIAKFRTDPENPVKSKLSILFDADISNMSLPAV